MTQTQSEAPVQNAAGDKVPDNPADFPASYKVELLDKHGEWKPAALEGALASTGNFWYHFNLSFVPVDSMAVTLERLANAVKLPCGTELVAKDVEVQAPKKYRKGHAKEGQDIPGTGGLPKRSVTAIVEHNGVPWLFRLTAFGKVRGAQEGVRLEMALNQRKFTYADYNVGEVAEGLEL